MVLAIAIVILYFAKIKPDQEAAIILAAELAEAERLAKIERKKYFTEFCPTNRNCSKGAFHASQTLTVNASLLYPKWYQVARVGYEKA